jgi:hypothetical protein
VTLVVLVALSPNLRLMARRLVRAGCPPEDAGSIAVCSALAALADSEDGAGGGGARELLAETWRHCRVEIRRGERARREVPTPTPDDWVEGAIAPTFEEHVLDRALDARVLSVDEAVLIHLTRGLGRSITSVSLEWGVPRDRLESARRRAEVRLRAMVEAERASEQQLSGGGR